MRRQNEWEQYKLYNVVEDETCSQITDEYIGQVTLKAHESYLRVNVQKGI